MTDLISKLILQSEVGDADEKLADVRKEQERLSKAIAASADDSGKATKATRVLVDQLKEQIDAERKLQFQIESTNDQYGERRKVLQANNRFDRTSEGVALAGDIESGLRGVGGAFGSIGLSNAERGISQVAEIPQLIEALPRLKEAFVGLPAVIGQAVTALGPAGIAFAAVGIAIGLAVESIVRDAQKLAKEVQHDIDTLRQTNIEIAQGLTSEGLKQKIEEINTLRQAEEQTLKDLEAEYQRTIEGYGAASAAAKASSFDEETRYQAIVKQQDVIAEYTRDLEGLSAFLESGRTATNDAAQAEQELEQARTTASSSNVTRAEQELAEQRNITAQVTQSNADAQRRATEAERRRNEAMQEAERELEKQRQAQKQYAETVATAKTDFQSAIQDIQTDFRDSVLDNQESLRRDLADLTTEYAREEQASARDHNRELAQIRKQGERAETDSIRNRDFAALAQAREERNEAIGDAQQSFKDEGDERRIEAGQQRRDITLEAQRATRDLQVEYQRAGRDAQIALQRQIASAKQKLSFEAQAYNQSLQLTQQFSNNMVSIFANMYNQITASSGRGVNGGTSNTDQRLLDLTSRPQFGAT